MEEEKVVPTSYPMLQLNNKKYLLLTNYFNRNKNIKDLLCLFRLKKKKRRKDEERKACSMFETSSI
jgi:hypothetical protein